MEDWDEVEVEVDLIVRIVGGRLERGRLKRKIECPGEHGTLSIKPTLALDFQITD